LDSIELGILLRNLMDRLERDERARYALVGSVTAGEMEALQTATAFFRATPSALSSAGSAVSPPPISVRPSLPSKSVGVTLSTKWPLAFDVIDLPPPPSHSRICLDFGTAMSKATLVTETPEGTEHIEVLELGRPGNQEEVSMVMLISSVFVDSEGLLWFGKAAVDRSLLQEDGARQRLDNVKRWLSEEGLDERVATQFNPLADRVPATYGDMVLAYLMFFTWAAGECVREAGLPRNIGRRYAMPCFPGEKMREVARRLRNFLGAAQVLADTFAGEIKTGIPLGKFLEAIHDLRSENRVYPFVLDELTEPLGVAGALLSWRTRADMVLLVVDVGAGTSDMSLFRILVDPARRSNDSRESKGSARGITEAGNYLDKVLVEFILSKAYLESSSPLAPRARNRLALRIRDLKETLFNEHRVVVSTPEIQEVVVELAEFEALDAIKQFGMSLQVTLRQILEEADPSWLNWIANPGRYLTIAFTGGGAELPMVTQLAKEPLQIAGRLVRVERALAIPKWIQDDHPELEDEFARIAVSLGGARKSVIRRGAETLVIGGDVTSPPQLEGYYTRGV
jgi:hypothetical protein